VAATGGNVRDEISSCSFWLYPKVRPQQPYGCGNMQAATKPGNGDDHHHPEREFRENRQGEQVVSDEVKDMRVH
jgi:hypothetical protein